MICSSCGQDKQETEFYKNGGSRRAYSCKVCFSARMKLRRTPDNVRRFNLRKRYGLTPEQVDRMHRQQNGRCKICMTNPDRGLVVDHCHGTGVVRGLLCHKRNKALGLLGDCADNAASAAEYLRHFLGRDLVDSR